MKFKKVVRLGRIILRYVVTWREKKNWVYFPTIYDQTEDLLEGGLKSSLFH